MDVAPSDHVLEIGPGRGAITGLLAARAAHVTAFEIDHELVPVLRASAAPNLTIVESDFLDQTEESLRAVLGRAAASPLRAVGNLPYNVASPILFKLVELFAAGIPLVDATVMLQREVADRLTAAPGTKQYGVLSVLIGHHAAAERIFSLPPGAFRPAPKVHSALVRLRFHRPDPPARDPAGFARLVQAIFTRRRKTLANALLAYVPTGIAEALARSGIDGRRRPETLRIAELVSLSDGFAVDRGRSAGR